MSVTSAEVARHAGVSRATVSQVLNGHADRFAPETRDKVLRAARDLAYQPSAAGRMLRRGSSDFVLGLIPDTTFSGNLQNVYERLTSGLAERGFTLVLQMAAADTEHLDRIITAMKPAAVLALTPFTAAEQALLAERAIPAIDPTSSTHLDHNYAIGQLQGQTLIARGHRHLAFAHLSDARQDPFGRAREAGLRDAAAEAGILDIDVVRLSIDPRSAADALADLRPPGVAIACYNDDVATALLSASLDRGWRIPDDVALIGMDRTPLSRVTLPPLTTIEYDLSEVARDAASSVLAALGAADGDAANTSAFSVVLTLVDGATS